MTTDKIRERQRMEADHWLERARYQDEMKRIKDERQTKNARLYRLVIYGVAGVFAIASAVRFVEWMGR